MADAPDLQTLLRKFKEYNPNQDTALIEKPITSPRKRTRTKSAKAESPTLRTAATSPAF